LALEVGLHAFDEQSNLWFLPGDETRFLDCPLSRVVTQPKTPFWLHIM